MVPVGIVYARAQVSRVAPTHAGPKTNTFRRASPAQKAPWLYHGRGPPTLGRDASLTASTAAANPQPSGSARGIKFTKRTGNLTVSPTPRQYKGGEARQKRAALGQRPL